MKLKSPLSLKFVITYLILVALAMVILVLGATEAYSRYLRWQETQVLYSHAQDLAEKYQSDASLPVEELLQRLRDYARGMDTVIWILDRDGQIQFSSEWNTCHDPIPTDFQPLDFENRNSITGTFYGMFDEPQLTVYTPLNTNFQTRGYVLVHEPLSALIPQQNTMMNLLLLGSGMIFALMALLMLFFHIAVHRPIRKITVAVQEYARGNLSYKAEVHSHDEFGYLADGLNDMSERLSRTEEDQKIFLANVSHDFRSPLTSIKGYLEAILDGTIPPELQPKYLKIVLDETGRLTKLTRNMLDLNTFSGGAYLNYSIFDINHAIRKAIASMEGNCREKGITFDMISSSRNLMVNADLDRIQQVLYNLIDNAIKFSPRDSVITIETSSRHELAFISVKDNGVGIAKENINKIWDRFYKTDTSRGKDKKGTGLGLSIVKEIIQAHGTNIDVISTEGVGTEFIFTLNLAEKEPEV